MDDDQCAAMIHAEPVQDSRHHEYGVAQVVCAGHAGHLGDKHEGIRTDSGRVVTWRGIEHE